jgi:hypothetical protein
LDTMAYEQNRAEKGTMHFTKSGVNWQ